MPSINSTSATTSTIRIIEAEPGIKLEALLGKDHVEFVNNLQSPTWLTLKGKDSSRRRAIVTLLHANEPSGLKAIHRLLKAGVTPHTDIGVMIVSVEAARYTPMFSHRYLPGEKDMNRCFGTKGDTPQEQLASEIVNCLADYAPEAVVDTHNTSAHSDAFAVATSSSAAVRQVTQLFTHKLVSLDQTLGTLIEQNIGCPVVTVEFGGFLDPNSDALAASSIEQYITRKQLFGVEPEPLQILQSPYRLEIKTGATLHYSTTVESNSDITIYNTIDQLNFRKLKPNTALGWVNNEELQKLVVSNSKKENIVSELFNIDDGFLKNTVPMTLFMATTDDNIARNDCLMYLCPEEE